jgi:very-short-patch-repair endonuclease
MGAALRIDDLPQAVQGQLLADHGISRPRPKQSTRTKDADTFWFQLRAHRLTGWVREYRFATESHGRQWRFDFCNPDPRLRLAVEIDGIVVRRIGGQMVCMGRHTSVDGYREDCVKLNTAAELGWTVLRFEQSMVKSGAAIATVERVLAARGVRRAV